MKMKNKSFMDLIIILTAVCVVFSFTAACYFSKGENTSKAYKNCIQVKNKIRNSVYSSVKLTLNNLNNNADILEDEAQNETEGVWTDIYLTQKKYAEEIQKGIYPQNGKVEGRDMSQYRATDSYNGIYIQNATDTKKVDIKDVTEKGSGLKIKKGNNPVVLIYHTHTTECYKIVDNGVYSEKWASRNNDINLNVVRVGDELAKQLERQGFKVLHDKTIYDSTYSGSYGRSRKTVQEYLKKYPDLLVTIDLHRDAIYGDGGIRYKPVTQIEGKKTAQVMIIAGTQEGSITDFPNWETNLAFALQIQKKGSEIFPTLMRPIFFARRDYNLDLTPYSLLLEFGTDANTLEEAVRAGECMGKVLGKVLEDCSVE